MTGPLLDPLDHTLRAIRGEPLSDLERDRFTRYLDLLMQWNATHDLTACRTAAEVVTRLFRDSLLFLRVLPARDPLRAVDIGAGAGIPGLPLRLVRPGLQLTMIESRRKRVSFLRAAERVLTLSDILIIEGRAEQIAKQDTDLVGKYDVALARGIAGGPLLEAALPYLRAGGLVIAGGPPSTSAPLPSATGYTEITWRRESLPALRLTRTFLIAQKQAAP